MERERKKERKKVTVWRESEKRHSGRNKQSEKAKGEWGRQSSRRDRTNIKMEWREDVDWYNSRDVDRGKYSESIIEDALRRADIRIHYKSRKKMQE